MISSIRFLNKIDEVERFLVIDEKEFCLIDGEVSFYKRGFKEGTFHFDAESFYEYNQLLFSDSNFYYSILDSRTVRLEGLDGYYFTNTFNKGLILFTGDDLLVYDFFSGNIIWKAPHFGDRSAWAMNEHGFVCMGKSFLSFYDYHNNRHIWQHQYSELLKGIAVDTIGNLITIGDHLFVWVYDDKDSQNHSTFRININTGDVIKEYKGFGGTLIPFNGHMIGKASKHEAAILNTLTNEITRYDLSELLNPHDIEMSWTLCQFSDDGLLYFVGSSRSRHAIGSKNKIGIINLNTQSLLWHTAIDIPEGNHNINQAVTAIKVQNNLLYAHCSDYTVHIFEMS